MSTQIRIAGDAALILRAGQVLTPASGEGALSANRTVYYDTNANPTIHIVVVNTSSHSVKVVETLPEGTVPGAMNNAGVWNSETRTITWELAAFVGTKMLSYASAGPKGLHTVSGSVEYDGSSSTQTLITGDTQFYIYDLSSGSVGGALTCRRSIAGSKVSLSTSPLETTSLQTIHEIVPEGLTVGNIDSSGSYNESTRTITWTFPDHASHTVSYQVSGAATVYTFAGSNAIFDTLSVAITGDGTLQIGSVGSTPDGSVAYRTFGGKKVSIQVVTPIGTSTQKIIEYLPAGITASAVSDGGTYSSSEKLITWVFNDGESRTLSYTVDGEEGAYHFGGVYQMSSKTGVIGGQNVLTIGDGVAYGSGAVRSVVGTLVYINIVAASDVTSYSVVESLPAAITPTGISSDGVYNPTTHKITFGPFSGSAARTVQYAVTGSGGNYTLAGTAKFNTIEEPVTGTSQVKIYDPTTGLDGYKYPAVTGSGPTAPGSNYPPNTSSGKPSGTQTGLPAVQTPTQTTFGRDTEPSGQAGGSTEVTFPWASDTPFSGGEPLPLPENRFITYDDSEFSSYV